MVYFIKVAVHFQLSSSYRSLVPCHNLPIFSEVIEYFLYLERRTPYLLSCTTDYRFTPFCTAVFKNFILYTYKKASKSYLQLKILFLKTNKILRSEPVRQVSKIQTFFGVFIENFL